MSETPVNAAPQILIEHITSGLREGRNKAMQHRKAAIQREFMIARRWVQESYDSYPPEDLPVDVHRIVRDLEVLRDQMIDHACWDIDREFRVTMGVLKLVAEKNPGYYASVSKQVAPAKGWKRPLPIISAPKIAAVLPEQVVVGLSTLRLADVFEALLVHKEEGITVNQVAKQMGLDGVEDMQARLALKKLFRFLRDSGHVETEGTGRGQRVKACESLLQLRDSLLNETEA